MRMSSQNTSEDLCGLCILYTLKEQRVEKLVSFDPVLFLNPGLCLNAYMRLMTTDPLSIPLA